MAFSTTMDTYRSNRTLYWILGVLAIVAGILFISINKTPKTPASDVVNAVAPGQQAPGDVLMIPDPLASPEPPSLAK